MQVIFGCCCGLDVHKRMVTACYRVQGNDGTVRKEIQTFGTMTADLLVLHDWLLSRKVTHVAMESTGVYWKPIYNILESSFTVLLVNAAHIKAVPGRKTDVKDCEWFADLLAHGLLKGGFIPSLPIRDLRDLTRYRKSLIDERTREVNRLHKLLKSSNIKLSSVATDVMGVSGRFMLEQILGHLDFLDEWIARISEEVASRIDPFYQQIDLLCTIPGVDRKTAEVILSEIGPDMGHFPSARHLASWAGLCPGNNESAGKRKSGKTRKGNQWLRRALLEAAWAASHTKDTYLGAQYHRLVIRRGKKKAIIAVAHSILVIAFHILKDHVPYRELGADFLDKLNASMIQRYHIKRLEGLGYKVTIEPMTKAA